MKRLLIVAFILYSRIANAQVEVVQAVKNDLVARNVTLSGPCGAFEITKRVAWILRSQGVGLLDKPGGTNCQGYSTDYLVFPDFSGRDILGDAGGENQPAWATEPNEPPGTFAGRWRAPFDPGDLPPAQPPTTPPGPSQPPTAGIQEQLNGIRSILQFDADVLARLTDDAEVHEKAEAEERAKAEAFRQAVGSEYAKFAKFTAKYLLPAVLAFFGGRAMTN